MSKGKEIIAVHTVTGEELIFNTRAEADRYFGVRNTVDTAIKKEKVLNNHRFYFVRDYKPSAIVPVVLPDNEKWIAGYEELYSVDTAGNIYSHDYNRTGIKTKMKFSTNRNKLCVELWKDKEVKACRVHRLVAEAHIPNPDSYNYVKFKDGNYRNVSAENLYWSKSNNVGGNQNE